jgi:membrane protein DedA with SNARE-associated domain
MDLGAFQPIFDWITQHPGWSGLAIFAIAAVESLAVVGILVPGVALMLMFGALVGLGALDLWYALAMAAGGAITGDGLSYWLGRRYHSTLKTFWPLSRYPDLIPRGEAFFKKHGNKSVLLGRFFGPLRAIIPAVAGMLRMSPVRFYIVNILSGIAWAPAVILPGAAFGASLGMASEVASRLVVLLFSVIVLLWLVLWLVRRVVRFTQPRADAMLEDMVRWTRKHTKLGPVLAAVVDPRQPESVGLIILGSILIAAVWVFIFLLKAVGQTDSLLYTDRTVLQMMQGLRSPWADDLMLLFVKVSDMRITLVFSAFFCLLLISRKNWKAVAHWFAALGYALIVPVVFHLTAPLSNVAHGFNSVLSPAFPSQALTLGTVVYGFYAVMVTREIAAGWRWLPHALVSMFIAAAALGRLYLSINLLTGVVGGIALGVAWVALLGIAYRRHSTASIPFARMIIPLAAVLLTTAVWNTMLPNDQALLQYKHARVLQTMNKPLWWENGWETFSVYRRDLEGAGMHPLNVQWAGTLTELAALLEKKGWHAPPKLTFSTALMWLARSPDLRKLPILPHVHDGRHSSFLLERNTDVPDRQLVLRLWPTDTQLCDSDKKIWVGAVTYLHLVRQMDLFVYPKTEPEFIKPLLELQSALTEIPHKIVKRSLTGLQPGLSLSQWDGSVLLITEHSSGKVHGYEK